MFVQAFCIRLEANINNWAYKETVLHVDSHFSRLLISLLNRYHSIELPDIGTLTLTKSEATFDEQESRILPPKNKIVLVRSIEDGGTTVLEAFEAGLIDINDFEAIKRQLAHMKSELVAKGHYLLSEVGSFTYVNGIVELEALSSNGLVSLQELQVRISDKRIDEELGRQANIEGGALSVSSEQSEKSPVISSNEEELRIKSSSVGTVVKNLPKVPWYHHLIPLLLLTSGVIGLVSLFRYCDDNKVSTEVVSGTKPLERMQDDVDPLSYADTTKLFDHPYLERYRNVLTQEVINDGCKIAVGSFAERKNAVNMMERIITEGYDALIIDSEKGSRVVIQFDCLEHDLIEYLQTIRKDVSEKAWYYLPKFEPDL